MIGPFHLALVPFAIATLVVATPADAKKIRSERVRPRLAGAPEQRSRDIPLDAWGRAGDGTHRGWVGPRASVAVDTFVLGSWTFDTFGVCDAEGWVSYDLTAQEGDYFHVDDFSGLGGGAYGRLVAPQGNQAMWCGARPHPTEMYLCNYAALPGYGNGWDQAFCTVSCLDVTGDVAVNYHIVWDSEPYYDFTTLEYDTCGGEFAAFDGGQLVFDGVGAEVRTSLLDAEQHNGNVRLRFHFTSDGAWSDEDGIFTTDGGVILDSLSVVDASGIVLPVELFEAEEVGAHETASGNWATCNEPTFGDFAALFPGVTVLQEDICNPNPGCLWAFFSGSTNTYRCGLLPQIAIPEGAAASSFGPREYINNEIYSPAIPFTGSGSTVLLEFDVYRDFPLDALVFFVWHVRPLVNGCPQSWQDRNFVYWEDDKLWSRQRFAVGDLIPPGTSDVQIALGVIDMCPFWCGVFGNGACHAHAPLFDNVALKRIDEYGPVWSVRDLDLFQDNFAEDGTLTGTVRADIALQLGEKTGGPIIPGDSALVTVADPEGGLATDPYTATGPAVYAYVSVWPQGQAGKTGANLTDDPTRWPVVDSLEHDGATWYCVRFDTSYTAAGYAVADRFCVDLNDNLFTPGDTVCFIYCAESAVAGHGPSYYSFQTGATDDLWEALGSPMEFTCLPAGGPARGGDILYVDHYDGHGAQPYFDDAFARLGIDHLIDRYDVRAPDGRNGNSLAGRVKDPLQQLIPAYRFIIWDSGSLPGLSNLSLGDGLRDEANDALLLIAFLENLTEPGGLYLSGDNIAADLKDYDAGPSVPVFTSLYIDFTLVDDNHRDFGLGLAPLVIGEPESCFEYAVWPDTLVAYGGCPNLLERFDVIAPAGSAALEASYHGGATNGGAIVSQRTLNPDSTTVGVMLSGFSFQSIRDDRPDGVTDRQVHLSRIINWLGGTAGVPTAAGERPGRNRLAQNYPNPFNPATAITYEIRERGHVRLSVYNIAGQRVATLVDEVRAAGVRHTAEWDGRNTRGERVASGVYFYKLSGPGFKKTRKMVLLK